MPLIHTGSAAETFIDSFPSVKNLYNIIFNLAMSNN